MRVLIAGGGRAGTSVASHLQASGHAVTILDREDAVARRAFEQYGLIALTGDATDARLLREAEVSRMDVVVAMLRRDADNLAVALLARAAGVSRVMVRMRDPEYRHVYVEAGVHRILSESDVFIGALATAIEHDAIRHSMLLGTGTSVAFELVVPVDAAVAGQQVMQIAGDPTFPRSCVFAGLWEPNGSVQSPRGSSVIVGGMAVLLVALREEMADVIQFFIRPRDGAARP